MLNRLNITEGSSDGRIPARAALPQPTDFFEQQFGVSATSPLRSGWQLHQLLKNWKEIRRGQLGKIGITL